VTDFRLLGPLEAAEAGARIPLPAGQPSAVLARLLIDANRAVPADNLVDAIWGERPPASARKVLQAYVSELRKALGADRIETRGGGYAVRVDAGELDLTRFEELTETARTTAEPARRSALLNQALSLWRGPALAEFREPFARVAARRLNDLRLSALEQRVDADLSLGRHDAAIPDLEALVADEPLREQPRRQLMLALYRGGRRAEALACYQDARRRLVGELGLEPGKALQELERAILRDDPALDADADRGLARGPVIATDETLLELLLPLSADGRELLLIDVVRVGRELPVRTAPEGVRTASFTSNTPADDLARLATEQQAELLVVTDPSAVPAVPVCDVALASVRAFRRSRPIVAPFGGGREEWAALELAAWLAHVHGLPLRLLGTEQSDGKRDASRLLAGASLALQRFTQVAVEPALVAPGAEGILAQESSLIVASLPSGELDTTRRRLRDESGVPVLLVRPGLRPSGFAPDHTLTRFSWSLAG
jgi:DNA-binding SARP family transcriptional activator